MTVASVPKKDLLDTLANWWRLVWNSALALAIFVIRLLIALLAAIPVSAGRLALGSARARRVGGWQPDANRRPRVLFIGGTLNQTTQVEQIAAELPECEVAFTWFYCDGVLEVFRRLGWLDTTALGNKLRARCLGYLKERNLPIDLGGIRGDYDLAVTCSDLSVPSRLRQRPIVLVQEGMTDPEDLIFQVVKTLRLPPWLACTSSASGLSHAYDRLCVASDGYRQLFVGKGVPAEKIVVTGIPNFDNCQRFQSNDFPHRGYVLVCSSDIRETARWENRPRFIREVLTIAAGRAVIWKLHPNEKVARARAEIGRLAPDALVMDQGSAEEMIANCDVLVTQFSSTAYVGLALGKEVHSYFDVEELGRLCPIQNGRTSAHRIANVCRGLLGVPTCDLSTTPALPSAAATVAPTARGASRVG
jgi:hypothetical protein